MLEIAEYLAHRAAPLAREVVFVAFCGEELGLRGSRQWTADPPWPLDRTVAVVNLEMLGRPEPRARPRAWITGLPLSDLGAWFVAPGSAVGVEFVGSEDIGIAEAHTFTRSDNLPFAEAGVVAHTIAAGRLDRLYHSANDVIETLDFERMALLVRAIALGIERLADAPDHPDWTERGRTEGYGR
jgi:Zn-dependent M28 family amino/carboxypeptidase